MSSAVVEIEVPVEETEAYQELMTRAGRRTGKIPAELMVRHVLACVPPHEWPTRVEAMDAVLRRLESARKDSLRVEARPADGRLLGLYVTRRPGAGSRPYRTVLHGVDPIEGRCDCPDFLKNSLGLCKHILVVLEHLHARPRVLQQAQKEQEWSDPRVGNGPVLGPDPAADGARRLAGSRRLEGRRRARQGAVGAGRAGAQVVPLEQGRRRDLEEQLLRTSPPGGSSWSKTCSRSSRPRAQRDRCTTPRCEPCSRASASGSSRWWSRRLSAAEIREAFKSMKRPLYPYQREGVERFLAAGRLLLADDMGLGKTAQAIACCDILRRTGRVRRGLIIAPASLKPQWAREWAGVLRPADPGRRRLARRTPGRSTPSARKGSSSSIMSSCSATSRSSAAGTPTWSCSTRRSGSRTGRPRRPSRSRG